MIESDRIPPARGLNNVQKYFDHCSNITLCYEDRIQTFFTQIVQVFF